MISVTLKAHYPGEHIVLDEPFQIPVDAPLMVIVLAPIGSERDLEGERTNWAALSAGNLAKAYGDDEPEYTVADLRPCLKGMWRSPLFHRRMDAPSHAR